MDLYLRNMKVELINVDQVFQISEPKIKYHAQKNVKVIFNYNPMHSLSSITIRTIQEHIMECG